ncbi:DUF1566 domain-containing protein [Leptospira sp. WS92.C1]
MKKITFIFSPILLILLIVASERFSVGPFNPGTVTGTVLDSATNLVWERCSRGQTSAADCAEAATTTDWETALTYCDGLTVGTLSDWRLPTIKELGTIVNYNFETPAIETALFPNTPSGLYWSSTTNPSDTSPGGRDKAMHIDFNEGGLEDSAKTATTLYVRCVTGP